MGKGQGKRALPLSRPHTGSSSSKTALSQADQLLWQAYVHSPLSFVSAPRSETPDKPSVFIDLHGLTLAQAHATFVRFAETHRACGSRRFVVICGKSGRMVKEVPGWCDTLGFVSACKPLIDQNGRHGAYQIVLSKRK